MCNRREKVECLLCKRAMYKENYSYYSKETDDPHDPDYIDPEPAEFGYGEEQTIICHDCCATIAEKALEKSRW